jgi:hypothetical protein
MGTILSYFQSRNGPTKLSHEEFKVVVLAWIDRYRNLFDPRIVERWISQCNKPFNQEDFETHQLVNDILRKNAIEASNRKDGTIPIFSAGMCDYFQACLEHSAKHGETWEVAEEIPSVIEELARKEFWKMEDAGWFDSCTQALFQYHDYEKRTDKMLVTGLKPRFFEATQWSHEFDADEEFNIQLCQDYNLIVTDFHGKNTHTIASANVPIELRPLFYLLQLRNSTARDEWDL